MSCDIDIEKIEKWMDSPEGQQRAKEFLEKLDRENKMKEKFFERVKNMPPDEQDKWMNAIISKYDSKQYQDRWYKQGIMPPQTLYYYIAEFMGRYGKVDGETKYGEPIYQYNHWRMDYMYGQGECVYNFEYSAEDAITNTYVGSDKYWENIFESETNRDKDLHNAFAELHDRLVNQVIAFCKEHNLEVDDVTLRIMNVQGSKDVGEWTSVTDSYMKMFDVNSWPNEDEPFLYRY